MFKKCRQYWLQRETVYDASSKRPHLCRMPHVNLSFYGAARSIPSPGVQVGDSLRQIHFPTLPSLYQAREGETGDNIREQTRCGWTAARGTKRAISSPLYLPQVRHHRFESLKPHVQYRRVLPNHSSHHRRLKADFGPTAQRETGQMRFSG